MTPKPVVWTPCWFMIRFFIFQSRDCFLSVRLTQMWPRTLSVNVHEQRVTKEIYYYYYYYYYYLCIRVFHIYLMVFYWCLSDSKSPQVSRTLLSILAVLNNVVVWIVSNRPPTSKSSSPFNNPLVTVPNAPITIGIIVTCMFHSFLKVEVLMLFSNSFSFILWSAGTAMSTILPVRFFCWLLLGLVFWLRLSDPCVCQSSIGVYVCHPLGQVLGCA